MKKETSNDTLTELKARIREHLEKLYTDEDVDTVCEEIIQLMAFDVNTRACPLHVNHWDEKDIVTITYGDSIKKQDELPLETLHHFLIEKLKDVVNTVHILPFYPFSSDDGFSVINFVEVNQSLGDWQHINTISKDFKLMADLVINHSSSRSLWFDNYKQGKSPGNEYFIECQPDVDLTEVVRPRTSPLLRETETCDGKKYVWCTFSHDQIDLNFKNIKVLLEFVKIIKVYLDQGVSLFRLDAVAFLWKKIGTPCINLFETHEVIRLLRLLIEHNNPAAVIITETNIPNRENLSYFGNANEAHLIYNFSLPPLILYTLLTGKSDLLKQWMMNMPQAQNGTTYFNFIASHDGIGLRPVEGLLSEEEVDELVRLMQSFGGDVSWRSMADGQIRPYELNISLIDAFKGTYQGEDQYQLNRFICAHAIMLALEGMPAFYIHSLLATQNDNTKLDRTSNKRSINRHNWDYDELMDLLEDDQSQHHQAFTQITRIISIRKKQAAFHPNAVQSTMNFGESLIAFQRQSQDRSQSIFCVYNVTNITQTFLLKDANLNEHNDWYDLISEHKYTDPGQELSLSAYDFVWITNKI